MTATTICSNTVRKPQDERNQTPMSVTSFDAAAALRDLIEAWGYNRYHQTSHELQAIGETLGKFIREKAYSRPYIANILAGKIDAGEKIANGILQLLAIVDGARQEEVTTHDTSIRTKHNVRPGSLVMVDSRPCTCGIHFIPTHPRQKFHTKECRKIWMRQQKSHSTRSITGTDRTSRNRNSPG